LTIGIIDVLNDNDGNFTNGGVYLDEITWDNETGQEVYPDDLALITGGEDIVISPFEFILPLKLQYHLQLLCIFLTKRKILIYSRKWYKAVFLYLLTIIHLLDNY